MGDKIDIKGYFSALKLPDWQYSGDLKVDSGGQSKVVEVIRSDGVKGVFRLLKSNSPIDIERFKREVSILTDPKFQNSHIVPIHLDSLTMESDGYWYISEKGESFIEYWLNFRRGKSAQSILERAIEIVLELSNALVNLHDEGVVHRDIKPENIVIIRGKTMLIDFGLVYLPKSQRITPRGSTTGNFGFSPEQARYWQDTVTPWFDIFNLGQLLIWMTFERSSKRWRGPIHWRFEERCNQNGNFCINNERLVRES